MSNFKLSIQKHTKGFHQYFPDLKKPILRTIIQVCVFYIEHKEFSSEILNKAIQKLNNSGCENIAYYKEMFVGIFIIIQIYLRQMKGSVKDDELKEVLKELKFPDESIEDLSKVLTNHRDPLAYNCYEIKCLRTPPKKFEWKINISLVDSGVTFRLSQPTIILNIQESNENYRTFEMTIAMFHKLRFNIAYLLREMHVLDGRQIMKK